VSAWPTGVLAVTATVVGADDSNEYVEYPDEQELLAVTTMVHGSTWAGNVCCTV
jgi:hypothetical protein